MVNSMCLMQWEVRVIVIVANIILGVVRRYCGRSG